LFTTHDSRGDTLYSADISTHPKFQRKGIGTMLYNVRKNLAIEMNLRRIVNGGRLFNYYKYTNKISAILDRNQKAKKKKTRFLSAWF
jgi:GNAT superfamily N-acetyltransferase